MAATGRKVWAKLEGGGVLCYVLDSDCTADLLHQVYKHHNVDYYAYGKVKLFDGTEIQPNFELHGTKTSFNEPIIVSLPLPPPPPSPPPSLGGMLLQKMGPALPVKCLVFKVLLCPLPLRELTGPAHTLVVKGC